MQVHFKSKFSEAVSGMRPNGSGFSPLESIPLSSSSHPKNLINSSLNNNHSKRPLKKREVSFNGLFTSKLIKYDTVKGIVNLVDKNYNNWAHNLFQKVASEAKIKGTDFKIISDGAYELTTKSKMREIAESALYPVTRMPVDILNWAVGGLKKLFKAGDDSLLGKLYNSEFLSAGRKNTQRENAFLSLKGLLEKAKKLKEEGASQEKIEREIFMLVSNSFNSKTGNYNTSHERALCRLVTGMIPALFLATDFYNLSNYCKDNDAEAEEAAKKRFKQEVLRVVPTAWLQLVILGAFSKVANSSVMIGAGIVGATAFFTELFSRLWQNVPVIPLNKERAQIYNKQYREESKENNIDISPYQGIPIAFKNRPELAKVYASFRGEEHNSVKDIAFKGDLSFLSKNPADFKLDAKTMDAIKTSTTLEPESELKGKKEKDTKAIISFKTLGSWMLGLIAAGYAIKGVRKNQVIDKYIHKNAKKMSDIYEKFTSNKVSLTKDELSKFLQTLRKNGQEYYANMYEEFAQRNYNAEKGLYNLGNQDKKFKFLADLTIYPLKFLLKIVPTFPYKTFKLASSFIKKLFVKDIELAKETARVIETLNAGKEVAAKDAKRISSELSAKLYDSRFSKALKAGLEKQLALQNGEDVIKKAQDIAKKLASASKTEDKVLFEEAQKIIKLIEQIKKDKELDSTLNKVYLSIQKRTASMNDEQLKTYLKSGIEKAFNEQNSKVNNSELANYSKLFSSSITTYFLINDHYNHVLIKSNGEDQKGADQMARERTVQRVSSIFYQMFFVTLFNNVFMKTYHSNLLGMSAVCGASTLANEYVSRKAIGMPVIKSSRTELIALEKENNEATGIKGAWFKFMSKLTGKKPIRERVPNNQNVTNQQNAKS